MTHTLEVSAESFLIVLRTARDEAFHIEQPFGAMMPGDRVRVTHRESPPIMLAVVGVDPVLHWREIVTLERMR
jgi:hypothetical protein